MQQQVLQPSSLLDSKTVKNNCSNKILQYLLLGVISKPSKRCWKNLIPTITVMQQITLLFSICSALKNTSPILIIRLNEIITEDCFWFLQMLCYFLTLYFGIYFCLRRSNLFFRDSHCWLPANISLLFICSN